MGPLPFERSCERGSVLSAASRRLLVDNGVRGQLRMSRVVRLPVRRRI